ARWPGPVMMDAKKPANTYRIFILGESAARGELEPPYAASRYLETLLDKRFPNTHFEVVNLGITAINSHVILPIARDCARTDGFGKTYLACAVGAQACREGYRTLYFYAPKFFRALESARADGSLFQWLKKLARAPLLIIDDLGIASVPGKLYRELLEVLDDRQGQGATLITSQFP